ncbi:autotransporter outer membrane beta-barrel domain-containing protein [Fodinicurvata sp. EGI_FJ10296]|uniref:autotransporter outer membrane beta-barrel domain-containing protein n=1 Tax=Fodinicurvata sp. EGI_FJ10296 TaxID=3231908 RepID=UPI003454F22F
MSQDRPSAAKGHVPGRDRGSLVKLGLFASVALVALNGTPALAQETTNFELNADNSSMNEFSTNFSSLSKNNFGQFDSGDKEFESGSNTFNYVTEFFTPSVSGNYIFGQTEAPVDTVLIVYKGSFDPANPAQNFVAFNDDNTSHETAGSTWDGDVPDGITVVTCSEGDTPLPQRCPIVGADLEEGEQYHVVISTFSRDKDLPFPFGFFVYGPGGVLVGEQEEVEEEIEQILTGLFEKPVTDQPQQPGGAYFDQIVEITDRDGDIFAALVPFAALSEDERRVFVESMSSNTSRAGLQTSNRQMTRSTLATLGSRLNRAGGASTSTGTTTATLAGERVQFAMADIGRNDGSPSLADARIGDASVGFDGRDTGDLAALASTLSFQDGSSVGQISSWAEGYIGRGDGPSFDYDLHGGLVGVDYRVSENLLAGVFFGIGRSVVEGGDAAAAEVDTDTTSTGLYAAWFEGPVSLNASVIAGFGRNENSRTIVGVTNEIVEGTNQSEEISISAGGRYRFDVTEQWEIAPTVQATHSWARQSSYTERGDTPLVMTYGSQNQTVWQTNLGIETAFSVIDDAETALSLFGGAGWGMTAQSGGSTRAALAGDTSGNGFTLRPDNDTRHSLELNAGLSWEQALNAGSSVALRAAYEGSFGEDETGHTGRLAVAYRW